MLVVAFFTAVRSTPLSEVMGVGTQMMKQSDGSGWVEATRLPLFTAAATNVARPASSSLVRPERNPATTSESISTPRTLKPTLAIRLAVGRPTYPNPNTQISAISYVLPNVWRPEEWGSNSAITST